MDKNQKSFWQNRANIRHDAHTKLNKLVKGFRRQPGFEDFLDAPSEGEIRAAAKNGPIVVINISKYRCEAILVEQHQIRSLGL